MPYWSRGVTLLGPQVPETQSVPRAAPSLLRRVFYFIRELSVQQSNYKLLATGECNLSGDRAKAALDEEKMCILIAEVVLLHTFERAKPTSFHFHYKQSAECFKGKDLSHLPLSAHIARNRSFLNI